MPVNRTVKTGRHLVDLHAREDANGGDVSFPIKGGNVIEEVRYEEPRRTGKIDTKAAFGSIRNNILKAFCRWPGIFLSAAIIRPNAGSRIASVARFRSAISQNIPALSLHYSKPADS